MDRLTSEQKELVWQRYFADQDAATKEDADWFFEQCYRRGFSPLDGVLIPVFYKGRMSIITTIQAFRLIANRTGQWTGVTPIEFTADGKEWTDCWLADTAPAAARVGVMRTTFEQPVMRVCRMRDYNTGRGLWLSMGPHMLGKCAEAAAFRAAFPEADGLYVAEEMDQAEARDSGRRDKAPPRQEPDQTPDKSQASELLAKAKKNMDAVVDQVKEADELAAAEAAAKLGTAGAEKLGRALSDPALSVFDDVLAALVAYIAEGDDNGLIEAVKASPENPENWPDTPSLRQEVRAFIKEAREAAEEAAD